MIYLVPIHSILSKGGKDALQDEFTNKTCKAQGNFSVEIEAIQKLMYKWDDVLKKLEDVSLQLEKGDKTSILTASKELAKSITNLQIYIAGAFVEVGSFVPGPIGVVCSVALAIGCFATGNIPGGFLNLLGAIPFSKCAKFLPKEKLLKIISDSGLNRFKPIGFERYMNGLSLNLSKLTIYKNNFSKLFDETIQQARRSTGNLIEGVGSAGRKTSPSIKGVGSSYRIKDGWEKDRFELKVIRSFEYGVKNL